MIKKIAWETFKNTGDINTFLELKQIENIENQISETNQINEVKDTNKNGKSKGEWNNLI